MAKSLINDFLRKQQEAGIKEVEQMKQHPYSSEQIKAQVKRIHEASLKNMRERQKRTTYPRKDN